LLRVPGERSDPGPKLANSTAYRPWAGSRSGYAHKRVEDARKTRLWLRPGHARVCDAV